VRTILVPSERNTSSNGLENLASRSPSRNRRPPPVSMSRFLACWLTQTESGFAVAFAKVTRLDPTSMKSSPRIFLPR
jgi:hypothetical protein